MRSGTKTKALHIAAVAALAASAGMLGWSDETFKQKSGRSTATRPAYPALTVIRGTHRRSRHRDGFSLVQGSQATSEAKETTDKLQQVRGVTWNWKDDAPADAKDQPGMGVIAQEIERVFPELVTTDAQGRKKVNYFGLIGPLIEAVRELDARLTALEAEMKRSRRG